MKLFSYFRSSAAYRVRIALNLKGLSYDYLPVNLLQGEQKGDAYLAQNPQALVPALLTDSDEVVAQSVAILEWLEETHPQPALLPAEPMARARVRSLVNSICCDVHPLCNSGVTNYLRDTHAVDEEGILQWYCTWVQRGFDAIELTLAAQNSRFCFGEAPGMADVLLVPQVYNADRFAISLLHYPHIRRVIDYCKALTAFANAAPEMQPDAPERYCQLKGQSVKLMA